MSDGQASALRWTPAWVIALVALWPLPGAAQAVLVVGTLAGLGWLLLRRSSGGIALLSGPAWALTSVLFCAYWLPEAVAALDAESGWQAWRSVLLDLRFLPFLWLAAAAVADPAGRDRVFRGLAVVALVWVADGLWAAASGHSVLHSFYLRLAQWTGVMGFEPLASAPGQGLGGAFGSGSPWFGMALAVLLPFALDWSQRGRGGLVLPVAVLAFTLALLLSASVMAWMASLCVVALLAQRLGTWRQRLALLATVAVGVALAGLWLAQVPAGAAADGGIARALARWLESATRVPDVVCVIQHHPLNGVGVGGLTAALAGCASPGALQADSLRSVPLVLQVLAQTGGIGLLLWLAGVALAWRAWRFADAAARARAWPALLALAALLFPINTSLPVYASPWGAVLLLLAGLYAGALWGRIDEAATQS